MPLQHLDDCRDETELTVILATHLFSQLSISPSFTIDNRKHSQLKRCPCTSKKCPKTGRYGKINYGDTSIGKAKAFLYFFSPPPACQSRISIHPVSLSLRHTRAWDKEFSSRRGGVVMSYAPFYAPERMIGGILFLSCLPVSLFCLFVCLSVFVSTLTFAITFEP